jgi:hypothetical protein
MKRNNSTRRGRLIRPGYCDKCKAYVPKLQRHLEEVHGVTPIFTLKTRDTVARSAGERQRWLRGRAKEKTKQGRRGKEELPRRKRGQAERLGRPMNVGGTSNLSDRCAAQTNRGTQCTRPISVQLGDLGYCIQHFEAMPQKNSSADLKNPFRASDHATGRVSTPPEFAVTTSGTAAGALKMGKSRFDNVRFSFVSASFEPEDLRGSVSFSDVKMVLEIHDLSGHQPYLIIGQRMGIAWKGVDEMLPNPSPVSAAWTQLDCRYLGIWVEDGDEWFFCFELPSHHNLRVDK